MNNLKSNLKHKTNARQIAILFCLFLIAAIFLQVLPTTTKGQTDDDSQINSNVPEVAPANDNFANAQTINGMSGQVTGTNVGSTKEGGEPAHALNRGGGSVWYKYTAPGNGALYLNTFASGFDTLLAVYIGSGLNNLKLVAANDEADENFYFTRWSKLRVGTKTGDTFYIVVDGKNNNDANGTHTGDIILNYSFENVAPNDNFANATAIHFDIDKLKVTTNVGASKESGEPNHAGNVGGKSVWYKWRTDLSVPKSFTFMLESILTQNSNSNVNALFSIYTGTSVNSLTEVASRQVGNKIGKIQFTATPNTDYYIAIDGLDSGTGADTGTFMLSYGITKSPKEADFDRDGKADLAVFRPTTGTWYSLDSVTDKMRGYQWGTNGDKPMLNDFSHDYVLDYTVFRPDTGIWFTNKNGAVQVHYWGTAGDISMTYNSYFGGSHYAYPIVFRPSNGTWYLYIGMNGIAYQWGQSGDIPLTADYDGDGNDELIVFRPSNGIWYILNTFTNQVQVISFGQNGDKPVPADYDGDGDADIAIYRPSTGTWWFRNQVTGEQTATQFGIAADKPQPADYDGDGKADIAVYRNGVWWIRQSSNNSVKTVTFGLSSDIAVTVPIP